MGGTVLGMQLGYPRMKRNVYSSALGPPLARLGMCRACRQTTVPQRRRAGDGAWTDRAWHRPTDPGEDPSTPSDLDVDTDAEVLEWGTDPNSADTDGDGFDDGEEIATNNNP